jgi:GTP-binding protein
LKITSSRFERAARRPEEAPAAPGPDVVFLGRSNVGKSSLINRMLGARGLARTSSSPGRTQTVNFYRVNERCYFVDLPGYGWARVPERVRRSWKPLVEGYLDRRRGRLALALLVVDARHDPSELDLEMRDWLEAEEVPYLVAATKSDKLGTSARARSERSLLAGFGEAGRAGGPLLVSVRSGSGMSRLWRHVDDALERWWDDANAGRGGAGPAPR